MKPSIVLLLLLAPFCAVAQTPPQQSNSAELPAACRELPVPAAFEAEAYAIDGDTLAFVGLKPHVRIWGIQAPELRDRDNLETVPGMRSRAALEDLVATAARKLSCRPTQWDRYCRLVAVCNARTQNALASTDLGLNMLSLGMAYGFYLDADAIAGLPDLSRLYASHEAAARKNRIGLWPIWMGDPKK